MKARYYLSYIVIVRARKIGPFLASFLSAVYPQSKEETHTAETFPKRFRLDDIRYYISLGCVSGAPMDRIDVFDLPQGYRGCINRPVHTNPSSAADYGELRTSRFQGMDEHASSRVRCRGALFPRRPRRFSARRLSHSSTPINPCETRQRCPHPRIFYYKKKISS